MSAEKNSILSRSLSILTRVSESPHRLTSAELAEELNLPKPTIYRLVNQLNDIGLLKRDPFGKGQIPGDKLQQLAMSVLSQGATNIPRRAVLQKLSDEVGETCNITFFDGQSLVYFDRVETDWPIRVQLPLGSRVPLHCTASGKLFLANMNKRLRKKMFEIMTFERHTKQTIIDANILEQELLQIKETGVGTDDEEFIKGMVAIAVPIIDKDGNMNFTIAIHAPTVRKSIDELRQYLPSLRRTAASMAALYAD